MSKYDFNDDTLAYSQLKKKCGSNHAKSGLMLDRFIQSWKLNGARMANWYVPIDNYGVTREYAYLSFWLAK